MYSNRIVAYIDLLGFSELVLKDGTSYSDIEAILSPFMQEVNKENDVFSLALSGQQAAAEKRKMEYVLIQEKADLTFGSDAVVWSYPADITNELQFSLIMMNVIHLFQSIQARMYRKGIVVRGGISYGRMHHGTKMIFGEALVKAFVLEKCANYPRIVIDAKILGGKLNHRLNKASISNDKEFYFIDYFRFLADAFRISKEFNDNEVEEITNHLFTMELEDAAKLINTGIKEPSVKVRLKYIWMYEQLNLYGLRSKVSKEILQPISPVNLLYYRIIRYWIETKQRFIK
ncbi:MAG TPA: hypothetical protein VD927_11340 [Chryseosolibacter sp.]|nr:hypothetical protein [Chryseosolibacter sp.]